MTETRSTCPYCGVGCGVLIASDGTQITGVRGDPEHPANFGRLCTKGATLALTAAPHVARQTRLLQPLRRLQRQGPAQALGWDAALQWACDRIAHTLRTHGPEAVGFYLSGQLLTEDYYVFNKLAKGLIGTPHLDSNSRLCMSSAVAGYKATLGADAPPACYDDLQHARCLFIAGSNAAYAHPVLFRRIEDAKRARPALKIIVVDPRRTDTAEIADLHLRIEPGTDVMLLHGMLHLMLREGWTDTRFIAAHTHGFEDLQTLVRDYPPQLVAQVCGISVDALTLAARWFAGIEPGEPRQPTLSLYCQGLNQSSSGTAKNTALINLHLATGQIGRPGAGPFSLTGQPNAMGGREVGALAQLLPGHRELANPAHRAEIAALWGVPDLPQRPGKTAVEMFQAAADGEIKALWIACTNPAQSLPDQATVRRALQRAEFVVVQEAFATAATCDFADLLLPATTWGEKEGTVTNSERRISRVRAAVLPPRSTDPTDPTDNGPRHDWAIAVDFAHRLEAVLRPGQATLFPYPHPESIWNEHRAATRGRDLDITGLSYAALELAPAQWPCPAGAASGAARLYADGIFPTADGRARFDAQPYQPVAEPRDARYPLALTTGRLRDQWHGMTRTGTLGRLFGHVPEPALELHPQDLARHGLQPGDLVHVASRRGSLIAPVQPSDALAPGQAFMAMHWGAEFLGGSGSGSNASPGSGVNGLTGAALCPRSKQPEFKHSAVRITKAALPWSLLAMAWLPEDEVLATHAALRTLMPQFAFAACVPFGRERSGVLLRAAAPAAPPDAVLTQIEQLLGLADAPALRYADRKTGQRRTMRLAPSGGDLLLQAFVLAGDTRAETWLRPLLQDALPAQPYGRLLLAPGAQAPITLAAASPQVCTCFNVREDAILSCLASCHGSEEGRLEALQQQLQCGTNCGSCIPQLRRLVRRSLPSAAAAA